MPCIPSAPTKDSISIFRRKESRRLTKSPGRKWASAFTMSTSRCFKITITNKSS